MNTKVTAGTITRTIVLILALVNQILSISGYAVLPIEDAQVETIVSTVWTVVASLWAWWKNNSFTKAAIAGDETMKVAKSYKA